MPRDNVCKIYYNRVKNLSTDILEKNAGHNPGACIYTPPPFHPFSTSTADWWRNLIKSKIRVTFSRCRYLDKSHVRDILCSPPPLSQPPNCTQLVISHSQSLYFVRGRAAEPSHFNFLRSRNIRAFPNLPSEARFCLNFKRLIWSYDTLWHFWTK